MVVRSQSGLVERASAVRATAAGNGERNARRTARGAGQELSSVGGLDACQLCASDGGGSASATGHNGSCIGIRELGMRIRFVTNRFAFEYEYL